MSSVPQHLNFVTLDVFTQTRYEGNPLAVVTVPKSASLTQAQKQAIAREFNLSETTFLHEQDGDELAWKVDIFITSGEIPFAGHPTIGTAVHILSKVTEARGVNSGAVEARFDIKAGPVELRYDVQSKSAKAAIPHNFHIHERKLSKQELLKQQSNLANANLKEAYPIVSVVRGMTFVLIELENEEALKQVSVTSQSLSIDGLDKDWDKTLLAVYFFVRFADRADGTRVLRTRMIEGALVGNTSLDLSLSIWLCSNAERPIAPPMAFRSPKLSLFDTC
jgi:PhzF family phenazine biosynthesis protein